MPDEVQIGQQLELLFVTDHEDHSLRALQVLNGRTAFPAPHGPQPKPKEVWLVEVVSYDEAREAYIVWCLEENIELRPQVEMATPQPNRGYRHPRKKKDK